MGPSNTSYLLKYSHFPRINDGRKSNHHHPLTRPHQGLNFWLNRGIGLVSPLNIPWRLSSRQDGVTLALAELPNGQVGKTDAFFATNKLVARWFKPWPFYAQTLEVTFPTFERVTYPFQKGHQQNCQVVDFFFVKICTFSHQSWKWVGWFFGKNSWLTFFDCFVFFWGGGITFPRTSSKRPWKVGLGRLVSGIRPSELLVLGSIKVADLSPKHLRKLSATDGTYGSKYWWNQGLAAWFRAKSTTLS